MLTEKRVAIMQPYFLPYLGYWQLMKCVDLFVIYDDIKYTKKGWINRNRFLLNGKDEYFSLPLKKDSDELDIVERQLADTFRVEKGKLLRKFENAYRRAPFFCDGMALLQACFSCDETNLFKFLLHSINVVKATLAIDTALQISSQLNVERTLRGQDRVIATCLRCNTSHYVNPIGGIELYDRNDFRNAGISLHFQKVRPYQYQQFEQTFIPHLSIGDVLMFNGIEKTKSLLCEMDLC